MELTNIEITRRLYKVRDINEDIGIIIDNFKFLKQEDLLMFIEMDDPGRCQKIISSLEDNDIDYRTAYQLTDKAIPLSVFEEALTFKTFEKVTYYLKRNMPYWWRTFIESPRVVGEIGIELDCILTLKKPESDEGFRKILKDYSESIIRETSGRDTSIGFIEKYKIRLRDLSDIKFKLIEENEFSGGDHLLSLLISNPFIEDDVCELLYNSYKRGLSMKAINYLTSITTNKDDLELRINKIFDNTFTIDFDRTVRPRDYLGWLGVVDRRVKEAKDSEDINSIWVNTVIEYNERRVYG